jgi:hypothetical protein
MGGIAHQKLAVSVKDTSALALNCFGAYVVLLIDGKGALGLNYKKIGYQSRKKKQKDRRDYEKAVVFCSWVASCARAVAFRFHSDPPVGIFMICSVLLRRNER